MRKSLKSTTALVMSAALAVPMPLLAGNHSNANGLTLCGDPAEPPCLTEDGAMLIKGKGKGLEQCDIDATLPCLTAEGFMKVEADSDVDMAVEADAPVADDTVAETETPVDDATEDTAVVEAEMEETPVAEDMAEADEMPAETAPDAQSEDIVQIEDEAGSETATTETVVNSDVDTTVPGADDPVESAAADGAEPAESGAVETDVAVETTTEDTAAPAAEEPKVVEAPATETETDTETEVAAETETIVEDDAAPVAAAALESDTDTTSTSAEVETVEVTEDNSRSASEDFETSASGEDAVASAESSDDDGLSNFEKALILGLGAAAVGSILNNGDEVVSNSGDRVVVQRNGELIVLKDDDALLRQPGAQVRTETFDDGSTRTTVLREDDTRIVTIRAADGRVLRRSRILADGSQIVLFDDTEAAEPVDVATLQETETQSIAVRDADTDALRRALEAAMVRDTGRSYSLRQIRQIPEVRALAPEIELDTITFATGSAAIEPSQAEELAELGQAMLDVIEARPGEVFLIEGHTDAVGDATYNLALSDRRAETVALALTEYFDVPPENLVTQGYGEAELKVQTADAERANRRATVRVITPLLSRSN